MNAAVLIVLAGCVSPADVHPPSRMTTLYMCPGFTKDEQSRLLQETLPAPVPPKDGLVAEAHDTAPAVKQSKPKRKHYRHRRRK